MSTRILREGGNLSGLSETFGAVVSMLGTAGADDYADLYVSVVGVRGNRPIGGIAVEAGRIMEAGAESEAALPDWVDPTDEEHERALLIAFLCKIIARWNWSFAEVARYLRCGPHLLDLWLNRARYGEVPGLPAAVVIRLRRLIVLEQGRILAGVSDDALATWLRRRRPALGRRSVQQLLATDGEQGYYRVLEWLLKNNPTESNGSTIH